MLKIWGLFEYLVKVQNLVPVLDMDSIIIFVILFQIICTIVRAWPLFDFFIDFVQMIIRSFDIKLKEPSIADLLNT